MLIYLKNNNDEEVCSVCVRKGLVGGRKAYGGEIVIKSNLNLKNYSNLLISYNNIELQSMVITCFCELASLSDIPKKYPTMSYIEICKCISVVIKGYSVSFNLKYSEM